MAQDDDIYDEINDSDRIYAPLSSSDNPVSPPDDLPTDDAWAADDTHPVTDTNLQTEENYDEGLWGAAEASDPSIGRHGVLGYDPSKDQRRRQTNQ